MKKGRRLKRNSTRRQTKCKRKRERGGRKKEGITGEKEMRKIDEKQVKKSAKNYYVWSEIRNNK